MELKQIKELIKLIDESDLNQVKIKDKDFSISLKKQSGEVVITSTQPSVVATQAPVAPISTPLASSESIKLTEQGEVVGSPMVGTFYSAPSPKSPTFAEAGSKIKKGDTIGIIEAMKIMNEIEAEFDFTVIDVLAKNEQPVEFNMPLYRVERN